MTGAEIETPILNRIKDTYGVEICRPLEKGILLHPALQIAILQKAFDSMDFDISTSSIVLSFPPLTPIVVIKAFEEMIFDHFGFSSLFFASSAFFLGYSPFLASQHRLIIDIGHDCTRISPIIGGNPLSHAFRRVDIGCMHMKVHLKEKLVHKRKDLAFEYGIIDQIFQKACFVPPSFKYYHSVLLERSLASSSPSSDTDTPLCDELSRLIALPSRPMSFNVSISVNSEKKTSKNWTQKIEMDSSSTLTAEELYQLAEGDKCPRPEDLPCSSSSSSHPIELDIERISCCEILFSPWIRGDFSFNPVTVKAQFKSCLVSRGSIVDALRESLAMCPISMRQELLANVCLCGGGSNIGGMPERIKSELESLFPCSSSSSSLEVDDSKAHVEEESEEDGADCERSSSVSKEQDGSCRGDDRTEGKGLKRRVPDHIVSNINVNRLPDGTDAVIYGMKRWSEGMEEERLRTWGIYREEWREKVSEGKDKSSMPLL
ncbi:putative multi-domain containing protein [Aduncisulcus paluster]|uniref:Multi-domain containing protein n=1 Tax=Aduncisulcus paluster TaxID=2918883 RepID=A0ABQ5KYX4_9EUKA|nr:putative multi-domain containing protein [Aduncisulcus paluster]